MTLFTQKSSKETLFQINFKSLIHNRLACLEGYRWGRGGSKRRALNKL